MTLDDRGGGTGAAPRIFRDPISVPTIPALACPIGIATQRLYLVSRLVVEQSATRLANFFAASVHLMQILPRLRPPPSQRIHAG